MLSKFPGAPDAAVYTEAIDGRPIFVIPWNEQVLVGTTEVADSSDPGAVRPSAEEIDYLLRSLRCLFPAIQPSRDDIHYAFAGVRPLPYSPRNSPSDVTRKHYFHDHAGEGAAQMLSVIGGKLTTAGSLARECAAKIGARISTPMLTVASEAGADVAMERWVLEVAERGGLTNEAAQGIVESYGKRALVVADLAHGSAEMHAPLCPHTHHIVAEAVDAFSNECACTLADVLLRRVPVALGGCWSSSCSRQAATRIGAVMAWNEDRVALELEAFERERENFLRNVSQARSIAEAKA